MVVLSHPDSSSFNHAIAMSTVFGLRRASLDVVLHDLYSEGFDPVLRVKEADTSRLLSDMHVVDNDDLVSLHRRELAAAAVVAIVHPNWWGKPPAMLAGWIDRVLAPGVAYALEDPVGLPAPLLRLRSLYVVNTSDTTGERESSVFGDPLQLIWERCIGSYLAPASFTRRVLRTVTDSTAEIRAEWLTTIEAEANQIGRSAVDDQPLDAQSRGRG